MDDFLEHFGIKGMKWGIRRDNPSGSKKTPAATAKKLTNTELTKRVNRLNMENRYSELTKQTERNSKSTGKRIVTDFVDSFGNTYPRELGKKGGKKAAGITVNFVGNLVSNRVGG